MTTPAGARRPPGRSTLYGWLIAEVVSLTGTRVSMVAVPWLVLTTTGSATRTGLAALAEMGPYVLARALGGPLLDRLGPTRVAVATNIASVAVVGLVPLLHAVGMLTFPLLLGLVAVAGVLRGPGDGAMHALVPAVVDEAGVPTERVTGLAGVVERLASTAGAALAGLLVAAVGPAQALVVDAASFAVCAAVLALTAPGRVPAPPDGGTDDTGYAAQLRAGWDFLRRDPVLVGITTMVAATNLLDAAYLSVLVPVWADSSGRGAAAIGLLLATFSGASMLGSGVAAVIGSRLRRFPTYVVAFLLTGAPRFVVLALDVPLWAVLGVGVVGGFASGFLNPILGAVVFERIPAPLVGRVSSLNTALCWVGIPFGGLLGGVLVSAAGLAPALLVVGAAYLMATMLPTLRPSWRDIERPAPAPEGPLTPEGPLATRHPPRADVAHR